MFAHTKDNSPSGYEDSDEFSTFATPDPEPLSLTTDIKPGIDADHACSGDLLGNNNHADTLLADYTPSQEAGNGSPLVESGLDLSNGLLRKKVPEVNNNNINILNSIDRSSAGGSFPQLSTNTNVKGEAYPPNVSLSQPSINFSTSDKSTMDTGKKSHHDQFAEFLLQKQLELQKQQQEQELLRQQQLELLKQEILRMSQITAQAQQAQANAEENAISQALQAQNQQSCLPKLTADTVQGFINNLSSSSTSNSADAATSVNFSSSAQNDLSDTKADIVPKQEPEQNEEMLVGSTKQMLSGQQQKISLPQYQSGSSMNKSNVCLSNSNIPRSPVHTSGGSLVSQLQQSPVLGNAIQVPLQSPKNSHVSFISRQQCSLSQPCNMPLVPPQSPVRSPAVHLNIPPQPPVSKSTKIRTTSHVPPQPPVPQSPTQRNGPLLLPQSPVQQQQHQAQFSQVPLSPLMQVPKTPTPRARVVSPQSTTNEMQSPPGSTVQQQNAKSLILPSPTRSILPTKQTSPVPVSPTNIGLQRPPASTVSSKVTMQSLLHTSNSQVIYQQPQQSLLNMPFSRGTTGVRLPTAQVRPMPPNSLLLTNAASTTSTLKDPVKADSAVTKTAPTKVNKSKAASKTATPAEPKETPPPKSKVTQSKLSKTKRKKPSHLVSPMNKTVLPQNGISITHEPVSPQALSKLHRTGEAPLIQIFPQPSQAFSPSPPTDTTISQQNTTAPSDPATPVPETPSPVDNRDDGDQLMTGLDEEGPKPSESTKKIIKALNEKYSRKSSKKNNHATNEKVSINELNDIIKHTIDKKAPSMKDPDGFVYDPTDICRGLGNIPLKPSLLGDPNISRFGVPRFQKKTPWQKFPLLHNRPSLSGSVLLPQEGQALQQAHEQLIVQQDVQKQTSKEEEHKEPDMQTSLESDQVHDLPSQNQLVQNIDQPQEVTIKPVPLITPDIKQSSPQLPSPVEAAKPLVFSSSTQGVTTAVQTKSVVTAVPISFTRSKSVVHPKDVVTSCVTSADAISDTVCSPTPMVPAPIMPQSAPVRLTQPTFPRIPTPTAASPTSSFSSAPQTPNMSAPQTPTATNCPTEPFGSMSLETLVRPPLANHRTPKGATSPSPVHFTPATTYSPETGSNVVVTVPQAGYNCPGPTIPLPQASPASGQSGALPPYHADLKSPDSGFNESCVSPLDASLPVSNSSDQSFLF